MRRALRVFLFLTVGVVIAGGIAGGYFYTRAQAPFKGYGAREQFVVIAPGTAVPEMRRSLVESGVIRDRFAFDLALWRGAYARRLRAGEYRFDRPMTAGQVLDKIARGDVYVRPVTFREGLTIEEMSRVFEERGFGRAADFLAAAKDPAAIRDLDPDASDLEGYLFPDTYALPRTVTAVALVQTMTARFRRVFEPLRADGLGSAARDLTVRQAVTLASLVEKETARPDERPLVAAVYLNRVRLRMGLQCDPTVIYALQRAGRYDGNLTREDLAFDSPYNTYKYPGLPPGPIAAPGRASLEAAVHPAPIDYLYFVSRNDGSHVFASTLAEHARNVRRYQVLYFREKRLREQGNRQDSGSGIRDSGREKQP